MLHKLQYACVCARAQHMWFTSSHVCVSLSFKVNFCVRMCVCQGGVMYFEYCMYMVTTKDRALIQSLGPAKYDMHLDDVLQYQYMFDIHNLRN